MNLVLMAAILEMVWPAPPWRTLLLLAPGSAVVTAAVISRTIDRHIPEEEVRTQFRAFE